MLSTIDVQKFNTLIEINALITNYMDVDSLLTRILESAAGLCGGEAASLLMVNHERRELQCTIALGMEVKKSTVKLGEGIAGWVAANNKSIMVNDSVNDIPAGYPFKTILAVPLRNKDACVGVIELVNKKDTNYFTEDDRAWLEIFANQAAIVIQNARSFEQARMEIESLQDQIKTDTGYHTMIAKSPAVIEKLGIVDRIAKTDSSVLILGESGVGKELFAEQIHLRSPRAAAPFIRVNCAALPAGLLESELFGHVRGAFTGAVRTRRGRFELAQGGTIFLDEIGDLPLPLQAKLLRVIQEKTFEKVGSEVSVTVNVRILAATNKDIEALVDKGEFRSDLYYRLNVLPLYVPPLRHRPEDIPELAEFFLKKSILETKKQFAGFSNESMEAMLSYSWPGNIRELENAVERACVVGKDPWIRREDIFPRLGGEAGAGAGGGEGDRSLKTALNVFKTHFIQKVLEENNWNQTEAAKSLDIQRTYLSRLVKELDIMNLKEN